MAQTSRLTLGGVVRSPAPRTWLAGLAAALAVAAAATALAVVIPLGSAPVLAIVLGLIVGTAVGPQAILKPGLRLAASSCLRAAVVVLGAELPLGPVLHEGLLSLPVIAITLGGTLLAARFVGAWLGVSAPLRTLIGAGTGVCGASAIAAVSSVIAATELEVGYAVATIFMFNVIAVFVFPLVGHALGMGQHSFGVFAGTAVNDLSSVVAVATVYGASSLHTAVIVKLTRTLMIIPICIGLARRQESRPASGRGRLGSAFSLVPGFLVAFVALAALNTAGLFPPSLVPTLSHVSTWLITIALAGVGLSINFAALRSTGGRPIVLGAALWGLITVLSLGCYAVGLA